MADNKVDCDELTAASFPASVLTVASPGFCPPKKIQEQISMLKDQDMTH